MTAFAAPLTAERVDRLHEASLEILEEVGMLVRNEKARHRFARHGCSVNEESHTVRFPRAVVEEFRAACPSTFTFHGREAQHDRTVPGDAPLMSTAGAAPNVIDPETGQERRARAGDIARIARLINQLPGYDLFSISVTASDAPPGRFHLWRYYPALKHCLKPVTGSAPNAQEARDVFELGCRIAGGEEAYRRRPFITYICCPVVSPLTMDVDSTEMLMHFTEEGLPTYTAFTPNAGLTAPLTLAGTLAQANAEFLAQLVLKQMTRPGTPCMYCVLPTVADLRKGAYAPGGIETGLLMMGFAQMARAYDVPCCGYVGLTNAKINDAQAGYETGMSALAAVLGGVHVLKTGGLLDALMAFDFAKAVIDGEIAHMLKRVARGIEPTEENLALDLIAETGPGGTFVNKTHTMARMRITALLPRIADRESRRRWAEQGSLDAQARAMERVQEILAADDEVAFSPDVEARIRAGWRDLPA